MENKKKKCSSKIHSKIDAVNYCQECKLFLCNKCLNFHSVLHENHTLYNLDKDLNNIFTDICKYENHLYKLEFYCKNHNELCCLACICKIIKEGYNQHKDCEVCEIKDIENEKKSKLKENIKCLEDLSQKLQTSIDELKILFEKINENKESLKLNIQKIFTKIRNCLNDREDEILLGIDNQFDKTYYSENIIKESEKLPNKTKILLEKGKTIENEWNNNKLNLLINDCINIENNIKEINNINEKIKNYNLSQNIQIKFYPEEENEINKFLEKIKSFGNIGGTNIDNYIYKFKACPNNIKEERKYMITGENENIITKTGTDCKWAGTICEYKLENSKEEYKWKIKILKSKNKDLMVGVAPIDFDINSSSYNTCGWYLYCHKNCNNPPLYSGPPYNYNYKSINLNKVKDEIIIIMNMNKRTLKFIIDNEDKGESYSDIPIDKPIFPVVLLGNKDDSVEIVKC